MNEIIQVAHRELVAKWMIANGFATGHGESLEELLRELGGQIAALRKAVEQYTKRYRWRPIAELHEDYGPCVLINLDDPGYLEIGSNVNLDYDESKWTHFTQITPLTIREAEALIAARIRGGE